MEDTSDKLYNVVLSVCHIKNKILRLCLSTCSQVNPLCCLLIISDILDITLALVGLSQLCYIPKSYRSIHRDE